MTQSVTASSLPLSASVAMCTYNGARFLPQQLQSIAAQTVLPAELVVCDDGSQDETIRLLEEFSALAAFPVRIFRNPVILKPARNFAQCVGLCSGEVIILTDQDDVWFADRIENTLSAFSANASLTFVFSECPLIDQHGNELARSIYSSVPISAQERAQLRKGTSLLPLLLRYGVLYGTTMAVRSNLRRLFLPLPKYWSHDEWIALTLSAAGPSTCLSKPVTRYRQHDGQQVGTGDWTLETHLGLARDHGPLYYKREMMRYRQAIATAQNHPLLRQNLIPFLQSKLAFLEDRHKVQTEGLRRIPLFLSMVTRGTYSKFASPVRSPIKDLLMLLGGFKSDRKHSADQNVNDTPLL